MRWARIDEPVALATPVMAQGYEGKPGLPGTFGNEGSLDSSSV